MQIYGNSNIQFKRMIPLKNYEGPVLKLTQAETKKVQALQESVNQTEIELYNLHKKYSGKRLPSAQFQFYSSTWDFLEYRIEMLKEMIREIKVNRFAIQKQASKK